MRLLIPSAGALCIALAQSAGAAAPQFTDEFPLEDCSFIASGGNAFFKLQPGRQLYLTNQQCVATGACDELEELWITVLGETKTIALTDDGRTQSITTRVVEERETADGELAEISRNFFATCRPSNDVYYFGEEVDIYEDGRIVSHEGAWLAGKHGAQPGIIMPDSAFILGSRYFQEMAPGVALDRANHVANDLEIQTGAGKFDDCIKVRETSPLDTGASIKHYCPGVGLVTDGDLTLQAIFSGK